MYDTVRGFQQAMLAATDARAREALQRVIRDQSLRFISVDDPPEGLPERAADEWGLALGSRLVAVDCDNTSWLREQLAEIAWFDIPTYGERADRAAWLITQHADRTPEFQREVLARLESLPPGHTTQRNLAYLSAENRPQRYGTQMQCDENGSMQPMGGLEDESNVDARRASIGLPPLEEYRVLMARTNPCQERQ
jgi:hypothetical protein